MGLSLMKASSCACGCKKDDGRQNAIIDEIEKYFKETPKKDWPPDPDPRNFKILSSAKVGKLVIAVIEYPDCENYEGKKILVFEKMTEKRLHKMKVIDPHFCKTNKSSPVARFEPTPRGAKMAWEFCEAWTSQSSSKT